MKQLKNKTLADAQHSGLLTHDSKPDKSTRKHKQQRRKCRRQPYTSDTRLADLIYPDHLDRLRNLYLALAPMLVNAREARRQNYLQFDLQQLRTRDLCCLLTKFIYGCPHKRVLKVSLAAFARWFTEKTFSNLPVNHKALVNRILEERNKLNLT